MEQATVIENGVGGALGSPSFEYVLSGRDGDLYTEFSSKIRYRNFDTHRAELGLEKNDLTLKVQYWHNENTRDTFGASRDTVVLGAAYKFDDIKITFDWSPDAFNAGERTRLGVQTFKRSGRWSYWSWGTTRYFHDRDQWNQEYWNKVSYDLTDASQMYVQHFESDYFGTTLSLGIKFGI